MAIEKSDYKDVFAATLANAQQLLPHVKQDDDALKQYMALWSDCAEKSAALDNFALQDVILLFVDASLFAFEKNDTAELLTNTQALFLQQWQYSVVNYINAPDNQETALALIKCLNNPVLAMGLEPEDELMLLDSFISVIDNLASVTTEQTQLDGSESGTISIWEKLAIALQATQLNLQEIVDYCDYDSEDFDGLKQYFSHWKVIAHLLEQETDARFSNLLEIVVLFIDFNSQLFNQTEHLDALQQVLLMQWHETFSEYIQTEGHQKFAADLIKYLSSSVWPQPISAEDEKMLLAELAVFDVSSNQGFVDSLALSTSIVSEKNDFALELQILEDSQTKSEPLSIWQQVNTPFTQAVLSLKNMVVDRGAQNQQAYTEHLQSYLKNWQYISKIIEADDEQNGLLDVVLLFMEISSSAFEETFLDNQSLARLKKWHSLFDNYLKGYGDKQFILPLVKCLSDPFWAAAITPEDEQMLVSNFKNQQNQSDVLTQPNFELPKVAEVSERAADLLTGDFIETPVDKSKDILEEDTFQAPESTATLWQKLNPLFNETTLALQTIVKNHSDNDLLALKQSLQRYLESWLAVAQQTETEGNQLPLLDVLLLFIEVSRQAFTELRNVDEKHIALLNKWQSLFNSYLQSHGNQMVAASLIKCLSDPLWSGAILPEDEEMLLAGFIAPEEEIEETSSQTFAFVEAATAIEETSDNDGSLVTSETMVFNNDVKEIAFETDTIVNPSIWQQIEPYFNQGAGFLKAAVDGEINNDTAAFKQGLQDYLACWQTIADIVANDEELLSLADVLLLFIELGKETFTALESVSSTQFALLNNWQHFFADYFKAENKAQFGFGLVKCLRDPSWNEPLQPEDELMLLDGLGIDKDYQHAVTEVEAAALPDNSDNDNRSRIWQEIQCFFDDTQSQLEAMQSLLAEENTQACYQYLQSYAEDWRVIAEVIAENQQLQTFSEISVLFADNCSEWFEENIHLTQERLHILFAWQVAFSQYFQNVAAENTGNKLCECLESTLWLRPITAVDKEMLLEIMTEENQHDSMFDAEGENLLLFNQGLFSEDDNGEFNLLSPEQNQAALIGSATEDDTLAGQSENIATPSEDLLSESKENRDNVVYVDEIVSLEVENVEGLNTAEVIENDNLVFDLSTEESESVTEVIEESINFIEKVEDKTVQDQIHQATTTVNPELIGMVRDEFSLLAKELNEEITDVADANAFKLILRNHEFKFQNLTKACNTIGLLGLEQVFAHVSFNMRSRRDIDIFTDAECELFKNTLPLIQNYIATITERDTAVALVAQLCLPGWKQPLTESQAKELLGLLTGLTLSSHNLQLDNRKTVAELTDVSLAVSEDVNSELLDSLLSELPTLTGNFSHVIQKIISGNGNVQHLLEAQRIAHTLKGSGNIVGVSGIAVVTHHLEEILEYLTEQQIFPTKALSAVLLKSADCLEMMSDFMLNGEREPPEQALQVLQNVLDWANKIATNGMPDEDEAGDVESTTLPAEPSTDLTPVVQEAKAVEPISMTRVPSEVIDELLRMTGEGSILSEQFKERIKRFSQELKSLNELTWHLQSLVSELDQFISIQGYSHKSSQNKASHEFDALEMEQYNELHTAASRISEAATDIREINIQMDQQLVDLKYLMAEEDSIQKENQEIVQSIRMVPASTITSRCQRIVRQACRATNKEVDLEIKGADILIDSEILNDMVEPLMHLLRNSIRHLS
jgi:HPt (histidine-containing phosphotransfer) domain-containing protein